MDATQDRSNRLSVTRSGGQLITDYCDNLFQARERGKQIVWYNGGALNPIFQAAGLAWGHGAPRPQEGNRPLALTRSGGQLITDYCDNLFQARERGKQIVWYNGGALNPIFQAAGLEQIVT